MSWNPQVMAENTELEVQRIAWMSRIHEQEHQGRDGAQGAPLHKGSGQESSVRFSLSEVHVLPP